MKTVIVATNNPHKAKEISGILNVEGMELISLPEANIVSDPVEDADDFVGNARIKARSAWEASGGRPVIADDSGLVVDALDGAPGVYSSRFAGEDGDDDANNALLLEKLAGVPSEERTARFVCSLVYIDKDGIEHIAQGSVEGRIADVISGSGGFGYDPLFIPDELDGVKTFGEVPQEEKDEISHRARALAQLRKLLV